MSGDVRCVWLTREQRDVLEWAKNHLQAHAADLPEHRVLHGQFLLGMSYAARDALTAWDAAPEDAWQEIADERRKHRCSDPNCFAESVLTRLGALSLPPSPFDLPEEAS